MASLPATSGSTNVAMLVDYTKTNEYHALMVINVATSMSIMGLIEKCNPCHGVFCVGLYWTLGWIHHVFSKGKVCMLEGVINSFVYMPRSTHCSACAILWVDV